MAGEQQIGDEAVRAKTGKVWREWFEILDAWGAPEKGHVETARYLGDELGVPPWWAQAVTVRYEQERGLRRVGETPKGWQVSATRTLEGSPEDVWRALVRDAGGWLGPARELRLEEGAAYRLDDGGRGEIRAVRPGARLRFTFEHPELEGPGTVEVRLTAKGGRTSVTFDHTGLASDREREPMRARWKAALKALARAVVA